MDSEQAANPIFTAPCSHSFHFHCIKAAVLHGPRDCPICRSPLPSASFHNFHLFDDDEPLPTPPSLPPPPTATASIETFPEFPAVAAASSLIIDLNYHGSKPQAVTTVDGLTKKKARKRLSEDSGLVGSKDHGDIKKKKRKKVLGTDDNARDIQKKKKKKVLGTGVGLSRDGGESHGKLAGKSIGIGHRHGEIGRIESQRRDAGVVRVSDLMSSAAAQPPRADPNSLGLEFPELLSDLRVLAVDPLFGTERDAPKIVLQAFCKFRTKVYLKSLAPPAIPELHAARVAAGRSLAAPAAGNAGAAFGKEAKDRREPSPASSTRVGPPPRRGKDGTGSGGSLTPHRALPHRQPPAPTAPLKSIIKKPGSISAARPPSSLPPPPPPPPLVVSQAPPSPLLPPVMVDGRELRGPAPTELNQPEPQQNGQQSESGEGNGQDFRNELLTLLVKCSQIVAHITSTRGYLPYHPL